MGRRPPRSTRTYTLFPYPTQFMRQTVDRLDLLRSNQAKQIVERLAQGGWRRSDATVVYLFCKVALPVVAAAAALFAVYGLDMFALSPTMKLCAVIVVALLGSRSEEHTSELQSLMRIS